jgi:hypothetical protein
MQHIVCSIIELKVLAFGEFLVISEICLFFSLLLRHFLIADLCIILILVAAFLINPVAIAAVFLLLVLILKLILELLIALGLAFLEFHLWLLIFLLPFGLFLGGLEVFDDAVLLSFPAHDAFQLFDLLDAAPHVVEYANYY